MLARWGGFGSGTKRRTGGFAGRGAPGISLDLPRPNQCGGIGPVAPLQNLSNNFCARASRQRAQFSKRFISIELGNERFVSVALRTCRSFCCNRSRSSLARGLGLSRNRSFGAAGAYIDPHQEPALLIGPPPLPPRCQFPPNRRRPAPTRHLSEF